MEVSGASSVAASNSTTVAVEVQKKSQEIQKETAETLIKAVPDPSSSKGQNVDILA